MSLDIRQAGPADLDDVRRIARAAYEHFTARIGREPAPMVADFATSISKGQLWVAGDPVAGFVVAYRRRDHWHLENVAAHPAAQGIGLGRTLITHVEAMARAGGAVAVELYTNAKMTGNLGLYPQLGYAEIGRGTEDGFDRVFYRKELR